MSDLVWIKHDGGPMPVPGDTIVLCEFEGGEREELKESYGHCDRASYWTDQWEDGYITAYAVVRDSSTASPLDTQEIDAHYTKYAIQPMEFSLANGLDAAQHTVVKYAVRYKDKGGVRDLRAAIRVLELMIEREEKADA